MPDSESKTTRQFPILGTKESIPWSVIAPHEGQAESNHSQTLKRLAERGGLSWTEALLVLTGKRLTFRDDPTAKAKVLEIVRSAESE